MALNGIMTSSMMETGCIYDPNEPKVLNSFLESVTHEDVENWKKEIGEFIIEWLDSKKGSIGQRTSGSTGNPKIIDLPKSWMRASARATAEALELKSGMQALLSIPARYIGGRMMIVRAMEIGMTLFAQEPSPCPNPENHIFDFCAMVPSQVATLLKEKKSLSDFGTILIGGAPIPPQLENDIEDSEAVCYSTFGMSETSSHVALRRIGESNDIYVCLPGVHASNWNDGQLALDIEHFDGQRFETKDVVEILDERRFRWLGRSDNVINSGGVKLYPEALERKYASSIPCPFFFHGIDDAELGSRLILCLENENKEVESQVRGISFDRFERPQEILSLERFMRTGNGKIKRTESIQANA